MVLAVATNAKKIAAEGYCWAVFAKCRTEFGTFSIRPLATSTQERRATKAKWPRTRFFNKPSKCWRLFARPCRKTISRELWGRLDAAIKELTIVFRTR